MGNNVKEHLNAASRLFHFKRLSILLELKGCFYRNKIQQQQQVQNRPVNRNLSALDYILKFEAGQCFAQ